ncbi:TetR/AcrR family transcriptional regulator [Streptomyces sp. NPDC057684]|uniref:TetR/AcrR family transcriptional regulator n=1 Tax=Streptomyces sp. NPDC057684 TaxID=3346211 RepID=UPI0036B4DE42
MAPRRADATPTPTEQVRRGQLIEATIDLICDKGCAAASLSAIAQQAGMSKAAVLYHFSSKDNLTQATLTHVLDSVTAYVTERVALASEPKGAVVAYVRSVVGYQRTERRHVRVVAEMLLDRRSGAASPVGRWGMLARLLADGQRAGVFREFDPEVVALAVGGAIEGVVSRWLTQPEFDLDAAASELETFTLYAIERPRPRLPAQASPESSAPRSVL